MIASAKAATGRAPTATITVSARIDSPPAKTTRAASELTPTASARTKSAPKSAAIRRNAMRRAVPNSNGSATVIGRSTNSSSAATRVIRTRSAASSCNAIIASRPATPPPRMTTSAGEEPCPIDMPATLRAGAPTTIAADYGCARHRSRAPCAHPRRRDQGAVPNAVIDGPSPRHSCHPGRGAPSRRRWRPSSFAERADSAASLPPTKGPLE